MYSFLATSSVFSSLPSDGSPCSAPLSRGWVAGWKVSGGRGAHGLKRVCRECKQRKSVVGDGSCWTPVMLSAVLRGSRFLSRSAPLCVAV